jgi:hypothetical protein
VDVTRQVRIEERWARALATLAAHGGGPAALCAACTAVLSRMDGAGVTLIAASGARDPVCATDAVARRLEELESVLGEGPGADAFARGGPVLTEDLAAPAATARWPAFAPAARDAGVTGLFVFPMQVGTIRLGVVSWYRGTGEPFGVVELTDALIITDLAAVVLLRARSEEKARGMAGGGDGRSLLRAKVQQATGMISVQLGVSLELALSRLRAYASVAERPIDEVADDVISHRVRFDDGQPDDTLRPTR